MASADSFEDTPSAHYAGTSSPHLAHTGLEPVRRRACIRLVGAGAEHRQHMPVVEQQRPLVRDPWEAEARPGWPELPGQPHARAPRQPCGGPLPPSCGLSTLYGSL